MAYKNKRSQYQSSYNKDRYAEDPEYAERRREIQRESYHRRKLDKPVSEGGRTRYQRRVDDGLCPKCCQPYSNPERKLCDGCAEKQRAANNKYFELAYDHYGRRCKCCGETERAFLSLDHMNNDGAEQRRKITGRTGRNVGSNWRFYMVRKAIKTGAWPEDIQTMCFNCNHGREINGGICPHQLKNQSAA
jgi:hypothetical protein